MEEHQWNLCDSTNGASLIEESVHDLQSLRTDLSHQLEESVDKLLIRPLTEYQLLLEKVESIIKKRTNKLLDYDRNRIAYEKMATNPARKNEMSEEKKILKVSVCDHMSILMNDHLTLFIARAIVESGYDGIRSIQQSPKTGTSSLTRSPFSNPQTRNPNTLGLPKTFLRQELRDILFISDFVACFGEGAAFHFGEV